ncbi:GDSL-like lipase/Acylhydrolase family protein [Sarocladium implicatum]|nr:GDSL-like lipase/Acylhydrolase family protein [Sarocladium implicatum]
MRSSLTKNTVFLGDSETNITCWRSLVWDQIESSGLASDVDFVGSNHGLNPNCSRSSTFDLDHEGHTRFRSLYVSSDITVYIKGWVQSTKPDIINIMLGNDDFNYGFRTMEGLLGDYEVIVRAARAANPQIKIILNKVIPVFWEGTTLPRLNAAIPGWAEGRTTAQSPITIADCSRDSGFTNDMLQKDLIHPNEEGDKFIAKQIGPKVIQAVEDVLRGV